MVETATQEREVKSNVLCKKAPAGIASLVSLQLLYCLQKCSLSWPSLCSRLRKAYI